MARKRYMAEHRFRSVEWRCWEGNNEVSRPCGVTNGRCADWEGAGDGAALSAVEVQGVQLIRRCDAVRNDRNAGDPRLSGRQSSVACGTGACALSMATCTLCCATERALLSNKRCF